MWPLATISSIAATSHPAAPFTPPALDVLMLVGFLGSILTLLFWMHQRQSRSRVAALAVCLAGMAIYGFLQGAWPLGIIECVWSVSAFQRWRHKTVVHKPNTRGLWVLAESRPRLWDNESRISRMFN
jgi:hypothetical protein